MDSSHSWVSDASRENKMQKKHILFS